MGCCCTEIIILSPAPARSPPCALFAGFSTLSMSLTSPSVHSAVNGSSTTTMANHAASLTTELREMVRRPKSVWPGLLKHNLQQKLIPGDGKSSSTVYMSCAMVLTAYRQLSLCITLRSTIRNSRQTLGNSTQGHRSHAESPTTIRSICPNR